MHGLAAEASFWTMLSLPPLLLALLALVGQVGAVVGADFSDRVATTLLDWASRIFTERTIDEAVRPLIVTTLREGDSGVLSISLLLALWSGSAAMSNYVSAITLAYDLDGLRSFWRTRLLSLGLYLAALVAGAVLLPTLVLGPGILAGLLARAPGPDLAWLVEAGYWPTVSLLSLAALTSLYHVAVPVRTRWRRDLPGAVLALLLWISGSLVLRIYLESGLRSDSGPVGAPIAILVFFFVTAVAVLLGAELNAAIDDMWPDRSTEKGRRDAAIERRRAGQGDRPRRDGPR
ncbi:YihY/virulence factor BrkB family protein [Paractinoplanes rishiriensis]|uniref:Membrane protein n=1 Tax=Paractinoplanes rishiriensis TaxID=1050105 RepID=A0A919K7R3_9ACTN|nr:YihY/virulence factor BrkB family protein [Actinoplanes rishiriensis]GIF01220.1 membrane protein [Actinoplanes rishiriensis]